jgi:L-alanine-DL-glutamate epimerase-like enolase superfamily enzyme
MARSTDVRVIGAALHFLPVKTRVPLKFGPETTTGVTCARVRLRVRDAAGREAEGWGETPLSVQWVWPSALSFEARDQALRELCRRLARRWAGFDGAGHPIEVGHAFIESELDAVTRALNAERGPAAEPVPHLGALVCDSAFDIALHDAYGQLHGLPVYETYDERFMTADLSRFLEPAPGAGVSFAGKYPADYLVRARPAELAAWHLVGGLDALGESDLRGDEPRDGHPVLLGDWIARDGLRCLKIKLRGHDAAWDFERIVTVGRIAVARDVDWLSLDFNCTVTDPAYVNDALDRLRDEHPRLYGMILYVEQPFPYDLERFRIDVHGVSARKPLFMDESAHDWRLVRLGRSLGWNGVALKTCKTQTGALLALAWARAHGMSLMVQDLTNPMLAMIPHALLAAHAGTIMGVETNQSQFYPAASEPEAAVHEGLFRRRRGRVSLASIAGPGFGYRLSEIGRALPPADVEAGS